MKRHMNRIVTMIAAAALIAPLAIAPVAAQQTKDKPKPSAVPTDTNSQRLPNRDDGKPTSPPTDPRNSATTDGKGQTSN